ncbi:proline-rich protein 15 [Silurus meridionalis]|uniref:proline-rich protein 15 n=1 Tax=Silurus meridionalis TaxID=175797 RepID=UPI001EEA7CBC|nr:proline-rich protein 15 [Silurus meridionalis]
MTEKTAPWWRSFVGKRRKTARESASILEQDLTAYASTESSQQPHAISTTPEQKGTSVSSSQAVGGKATFTDDTYDDSVVQPTFSESANRRNLRVSRSGRFKEKRQTRVGIPEHYENTERVEPPSKSNKD